MYECWRTLLACAQLDRLDQTVDCVHSWAAFDILVCSGADQGQQAPLPVVEPRTLVANAPTGNKADSDAGWQEVTRQGKKQASTVDPVA